VSQPLVLVERNSTQCCVVRTLEDSSAVKLDVIDECTFKSRGDYDHMKCIFDSLPETLSHEQRVKTVNLLKSGSDIFSKDEYDFGRTHSLLHHIDTGSQAPIRQTLRRHPMEHAPVIAKFVDEVLESKIVSRSSSDPASSVLLIKRADNSGDHM
jgi:hypothetical protein